MEMGLGGLCLHGKCARRSPVWSFLGENLGPAGVAVCRETMYSMGLSCLLFTA